MATITPRHRIVNSNYIGNLPFYSLIDSSLSTNYARCKTTSKIDESNPNSDSGISKELDTTDPDSIYAKVKYEDRISNEEDMKGRDGIASSPDHFSSLDETGQDESIRDKIKRRIGDMFTKK